jgi:hypothetical protein
LRAKRSRKQEARIRTYLDFLFLILVSQILILNTWDFNVV